jgi:general secretion pathway protein K
MGMRSDTRGVALLIVLWLLVLLAGLAAGIAATARTETHLARNLVAEAKARHLAQAGIHHAITTLFELRRNASLPPDGSVVGTVEIGGAEIRYSVRDECGKIDLNTARGGLILGLLLANQVAETRATSIAQAILDWRDPDSRRRPHGAEDRDYAAAGRRHGARDGLFESIDELQQVLGMTTALYRRMAPDLTVDCLNAGVEPLAASPAVLASIPNLDPLQVVAFLRARRAAAAGDTAGEPPSLAAGGRYVEGSEGQVFGITATAATDGGARVRWQAVAWLTGDPERPYAIRRWRRLPAEEMLDE